MTTKTKQLMQHKSMPRAKNAGFFNVTVGGRVQLKRDGTRWRTGGEVKGKLANGVGSQYPSHYLGAWCIQNYYCWCAYLGCHQSTELTPTRRFKWTRPFHRKTKSGLCACAITFQTQFTCSYRWAIYCDVLSSLVIVAYLQNKDRRNRRHICACG